MKIKSVGTIIFSLKLSITYVGTGQGLKSFPAVLLSVTFPYCEDDNQSWVSFIWRQEYEISDSMLFREISILQRGDKNYPQVHAYHPTHHQ